MNLNNKILDLSVFGESHGPVVGATLTGLPSGIKINENIIKKYLAQRRSQNEYETKRIEDDEFQILSGVTNGFSNGNPITIIVKNKNVDDSEEVLARPSHGDYETFLKQGNYADLRGGGLSSGRLTAPIVALGSIVIEILKSKNIFINSSPYINEELLKVAQNDLDSLGALVSVNVQGVEGGLGGNLFDSLESKIGSAMLAIPGVKGIQFGLGFKFANKFASQVNDQFEIEKGLVKFKSNNSGGINAGITNGEDINFSVVFKPTPTIQKNQNYLDLKNMVIKNQKLCTRNDVCIARRGQYVINALTAIIILDALLQKYGSEYLKLCVTI